MGAIRILLLRNENKMKSLVYLTLNEQFANKYKVMLVEIFLLWLRLNFLKILPRNSIRNTNSVLNCLSI